MQLRDGDLFLRHVFSDSKWILLYRLFQLMKLSAIDWFARIIL
jgi:hypothetical protein